MHRGPLSRARLSCVNAELAGPIVKPGGERDVLTLPVLLLNRFFAPVTVASVRRAFVLLYGGAAHAVDDHGETHDFDGWMRMPLRSNDDPLPIVGGAVRVVVSGVGR